MTTVNALPVCKYYQSNNCARGSSCMFSHEQRVMTHEAPRSICIFYQQGSCTFGKSCRHLHDKSLLKSADSWRNPIVNDLFVNPILKSPTFASCKFFALGNCVNGESCPFVHTQNSSPTAPTSPFSAKFNVKKEVQRIAPVDTALRSPCRFFQSGTCMRANTCQFSHTSQIPPQIDEPVPKSQSTRSPLLSHTSLEALVKLHPAAVAVPEATATGLELDHLQAIEPCIADGDRDDSHTERLILNCRVQFGGGAVVQHVTTPFDSTRVFISNLPRVVTQEELIELVEPFGSLASAVIDNCSTATSPCARVEYAQCAQATRAVEMLNKKRFRGKRLVARLDIRAVETGVGLLLSRKVKVSWYAPSILAWAHYDTISFAKAQALRLDGQQYEAHSISTSFQTPSYGQTESFSVEIKGLPLDVDRSDLLLFCRTNSVTVGRPTYNLGMGTDAVRLKLGILDSFDVLPYDQRKAKITAFAQFSSADAAMAAVAKYHGAPQIFLKRSPLWLEQVHSIKYNIPSIQFYAIKTRIQSLQAAGEHQCKLQYHDHDENGMLAEPVCIRIYGADPQHLGQLKRRLETLIQGHVLMVGGKAVWNEYFEHPQGQDFLNDMNASASLFVKADMRTRQLLIFGSETEVERMSLRILHQLEEVLARQHIITLDKLKIRALVSGGFTYLQKSMDAGELRLDVVARTLTVEGSADQVDFIRRTITTLYDNSLHPAAKVEYSEATCPVCFCEASEPIALACGHTYCTSCLQHMLRSATGPNFSPLLCVSETTSATQGSKICAKNISSSILRQLLSSEEENRVFESSFLAYIHSRPKEFHYCPTPDCQVIYRQTQEGASLQCSNCLSRICGACNVEFHEGLTCGQHRDNLEGGNDAFRRWKEANGVKPCPNCQASLEKNGGCNHMTCAQCKTHICWVCMRTFSDEDSSGGVYQHMRTAHGGMY